MISIDREKVKEALAHAKMVRENSEGKLKEWIIELINLADLYLSHELVEPMEVLELKSEMNDTCQTCKSAVAGCNLTCSILPNKLLHKLGKSELLTEKETIKNLEKDYILIPISKIKKLDGATLPDEYQFLSIGGILIIISDKLAKVLVGRVSK